MKRALGTMTSWATFSKATQELDVYTQDLEDHVPESEHLGRVKTGLFHDMEQQVGKPAASQGLGKQRHSHRGNEHAIVD